MGANEKHAATYHGVSHNPDTDLVRTVYAGASPVPSYEDRETAFNCWLETVRAEAKAEALEEAADTLNPELINYRRDAMEALSQPIRPAGGDSTMSLQLALVAANRTAVWLRARA
ncbi:hypothetical protein, partial [Glutamicibacter sp. MCAF14]|uniref:hypothetical protein n=1 Tax=Glutamicibacter sp. MCAF14 TaxID=3233043 RepID=UPI003F938BFA